MSRKEKKDTGARADIYARISAWLCAGFAVLVTITAKIPRPRSYIEVLNKGSKGVGHRGPCVAVSALSLSIAPTSRLSSTHSGGRERCRIL